MRKITTEEVSFFDQYSDHPESKKLQKISKLLDDLSLINVIAHNDFLNSNQSKVGANGLSVETIIRCAVLQQMYSFSFYQLSFIIQDSASFRAFVRLPYGKNPGKSALNENISKISDSSWEAINLLILEKAAAEGVEKGRTVRLDSSVTQTNIHHPTDSSLLDDCVKVMTRLLVYASEFAPGDITYTNHTRVVGRLAFQIAQNPGVKESKQLYKDLLKYANKNFKSFVNAVDLVTKRVRFSIDSEAWLSQANHFSQLIQNVIDQTQRRILKGESVPASEKIFSIFEEHSDIIIKGKREIVYGHKWNMVTGQSGLVLDLVIEDGNPADSEKFLEMIDRQITIFKRPPRQIASDGAYASIDNLNKGKKRGIKDISFNKKRGLKIEDMVKSKWVYKKLTRFRAGIEATVSRLKRAFGLGRCPRRSLAHFKAYMWSSVVACNLVVLANLL